MSKALATIFDFSNIKSFVITNGILIAIASYTVGHASASLIKVFVVNVLMPAIYYVFIKHALKAVSYDGYIYIGRIFMGSKQFDLEELLREFIAWSLTCVMAYFFVVYLLQRIFATDITKQEEHKFL